MDARPSPPVTPARTPLPTRPAPGFCLVPDDAPEPVDAPGLDARAEAWARWLRDAGLRRGDRLACAVAPGAAFAALVLAATRLGLAFAPAPPNADLEQLLDGADARLVVAPNAAGAARASPAPDGGPLASSAPVLRPASGDSTPGVAFLVQTSGSTGAPRRVALSGANVAAVLASHTAPLGLTDGAAAASVLPWHHVFGLVLELLPALLGGAALVRDRAGGRDLASLLALAGRGRGGRRVTHLHAVPHTVRLLAEHERGAAWLAGLRGGLVGGAPVDAWLARQLAATRLRVGYGQTEAAPGIALGEPGAWRAGTLGRPIGCEVRLDDDGVLAFRGPNACLGEFRDAALHRLPPDRWVRTGDLARAEPDGTYTLEGRAADSFKLENGRYVAALTVERVVLARWPHLTDALLSTPDGRSLVLAVSAADPRALLPNADDVAPLLGPLARRPLQVKRVAAGAWVRTAKGELDRRFPLGRPDADGG